MAHETYSFGPQSPLQEARKREFLEQMEQVVPWAALVELITPYYPEGRTGWPPFSLMTMLRIHFMQQWFKLSDPAMEEAFFDTPLYREFAQLDEFARLPEESIILRFRHRLEIHKLAEQILVTVNEFLTQRGLLLKAGTAVHATLIAAPTSTKNNSKARDPEMHSSEKGNQWYFGMKAHIGVDADSGLVHTVRSTSGHVSDVAEGNTLLHGQETVAFGDAGYQGIEKRPDVKAGVRAKVEHPLRVIKRQFGFVKVRYRGLKKNTAQLFTLFALFNLWIGAQQIDGSRGMSAPANRVSTLQRAEMAQTALGNGRVSGDLS